MSIFCTTIWKIFIYTTIHVIPPLIPLSHEQHTPITEIDCTQTQIQT